MNIMYIGDQRIKVSQSGWSCWTKDMMTRKIIPFHSSFRHRNKRQRERYYRRQKRKRQKAWGYNA